MEKPKDLQILGLSLGPLALQGSWELARRGLTPPRSPPGSRRHFFAFPRGRTRPRA